MKSFMALTVFTGDNNNLVSLPHESDMIQQMLESQPLGVLATSHQGLPHTSLVAYACLPGMREIVFATSRTTRKFENLSHSPQAAFLIDNRSNQESDFHQAAAVTAYGHAREAGTDERDRYVKVLVAKHPSLLDFAMAPTTGVIVITVSRYSMVTRFQQVIDLVMP